MGAEQLGFGAFYLIANRRESFLVIYGIIFEAHTEEIRLAEGWT
jgi:hypothetical protein